MCAIAGRIGSNLAEIVPGYPLAARLTGDWTCHRLEQTPEDLEDLTFAARPMAPEVSAFEASPSASA